MSGRTRPRQRVVYGAVLCSCLFVLLGATPTAAVVSPDGASGGAVDADGRWEWGSVDPVDDWVGSIVGGGDGSGNGGTGSAGEPGETDGAARARRETVGVAAAASSDPTNCDPGSARADGVPDGTHTAVLDRIEDGLAVLEVSDDGGGTHELVVEVDELPTDGRHPNAVFEIRTTDGELRNATNDESRSEARLENAQDRFDELTAQPDDEDEEGE